MGPVSRPFDEFFSFSLVWCNGMHGISTGCVLDSCMLPSTFPGMFYEELCVTLFQVCVYVGNSGMVRAFSQFPHNGSFSCFCLVDVLKKGGFALYRHHHHRSCLRVSAV